MVGECAAVVAERTAAGSADPLPSVREALHVWRGEGGDTEWDTQDMVLLETTIDDMSAEHTAHLTTTLLEAGAKDVWSSPVCMKKSRMGVVVSALCLPVDRESLLRIIFTQSSSIGVRQQPIARAALARSTATVETPYGSVNVKVSSMGKRVVTVKSEFDDCQTLAQQANVPLKQVRVAADVAIQARFFA